MHTTVRAKIVRLVLASLFIAAAATAAHASVEISTRPTKNISCTGGVCTATAKKAVLNVNDVTSMLSAGDLTVKTGNGALTITVSAPFAWASTHRLTLDAQFNISFKAPVTVMGTGAVTIVTNDGGTGGDLNFFPGGKLDFWDTSSKLTIQGQTYSLIKDIRSLASAVAANAAGAFALANDYDASADGTYRGSAVETPFTGQFDGLGHDIANFSFDNCDQFGGFFFEVSESSGVLANVNLSNAKAISCKANSLGLLAGFNYGTIRRVDVSGSMLISETGRDFNSFDVGGIVGGNDGTVAASDADVAITCRKKGCRIDKQDYGAVGALVGRNFATIETSHSSGSITGWNNKIVAGGLVGITDGDIVQSFSDADVAIEGADVSYLSSAGGLVGAANGTSAITDSYATGSVASTNSASVGGFVGLVRSGGTGAHAYSTGTVTAPHGALLGGFVGVDDTPGDLSETYWDLDTSGVSDPGQGAGNNDNDPGITGLTDAQLKSALPAGFDPAIWGRSPSINNGYPYLLTNPPQQ